MRKVFLDNLPRKGKNIDWSNCIGHKVKFTYDDIEGFVTILNYNKGLLLIQYDENTPFGIYAGNFRMCNLGKLLNKHTSDYKIDVDYNFIDERRNLTIIDREYRQSKTSSQILKFYKYHCNICGYESWNEESVILRGTCCACCCFNPKIVVKGINDITTTAPWMIDLGVDFEEAKKFTKCSSKKIKCICPHCGKEFYKSINNINQSKSIGCNCGDGFSYPEKFVCSLLKQLGVEFETQYSPEWVGKKRYDFYIPSLKCIIETHGLQHYEDGKGVYKTKLCLQKEIDMYKRESALNNNIEHYIELDCRNSDLEWIKNSVVNSELKELFDLSNIDWLKCEEYAINSNKVKEVCELWNNIEGNKSTTKLLKQIKLAQVTIIIYLKQGNRLGWCEYPIKK